MRVGGGRRLDAAEWDRCDDVRVLSLTLYALDNRLTDRKLRLITCAFARTFAQPTSEIWVHHAIEAGEAMADGTSPKILPGVIRQQLPDCLARTCIDPTPGTSWPLVAIPDRRLAETYRDLVPNPFISLTWNPEWFTSTVRELAAHIYASREFSTMPILADALQDAGCDNEQILNHCRVERSHARGCWVLDAILGKT